jgi:hypothetical protein
MKRTSCALLALAFALPGPARAEPRWSPFPGAAAAFFLRDRGRVVGLYDARTDTFTPLDPRTGSWGRPCHPPVDPPRNFGVLDWTPNGTRYLLNGRPVGREQVLQALAGGSVPDNTRKGQLTVIGEGRERVLRDLKDHPGLAGWRDRLVVRSYDPGHWHLRPGFVTAGKPVVYAQWPVPGTKDYEVRHRQDDYSGGPDALLAALRRADPSYDPARDPDRRKPDRPPDNPPVTPAPAAPKPLPLLAGLGLLAWLFLRRRVP